MFKEPELIYEIELSKEDFENTHNKALFMTINFLAEKRNIKKLEFDSATLVTEAKKHKKVIKGLKNEFGKKNELVKYIKTLQNYDAEPQNIDIHINELLKASLINRINRKNKQLKRELINNFDQLELEEVANKVETNILSITNDYTNNKDYKPVRIGEGMMGEYLNRKINNNGFVGYPIPFQRLNKVSEGLLRKGGVTVVNAKAKVGKSTVIKNIVKHLGVDVGLPVFWGANEEEPDDQKDKLLAEVTGINTTFLANGLYNKKGNEKIKEKVIKGIKKIEDADIFIEQIRGYTPEKLIKRARYYKKRHNIVLFAWDYVKRSSAYYGTDKALRHWMGDVVNVMKEEIADPLELAVLTGSQAKTYDAFLPAESQDIARHCTAFVVLRKLSKKESNQNPIKGGEYGFFIKYNRFGKAHNDPDTEWIPLKFDESRLRFKECIE